MGDPVLPKNDLPGITADDYPSAPVTTEKHREPGGSGLYPRQEAATGFHPNLAGHAKHNHGATTGFAAATPQIGNNRLPPLGKKG